MSEEMKTRKQMNRLEVFYLMQWIQSQDPDVLRNETMMEIHKRAEQDLGVRVRKLAISSIRAAMSDLGLSCKAARGVGEGIDISPVALLSRIKKLEKFIFTHFANEWAQLD